MVDLEAESAYRQRFKEFVEGVYEHNGKPQGQAFKDFVDQHFGALLSASGFRNWKRGDNVSYDIRQLRILSALRGWSLAKTIAYLYDISEAQVKEEPVSLGKFDPLILRDRNVPIDKVLQALQICADRLNLFFGSSRENTIAVKSDSSHITSSPMNSMRYPTLTALLAAAFEYKGWTMAQGIERFVALRVEEKEDYWRGVLAGVIEPTDRDYEFMAQTLSMLTDKEWTVLMLAQKTTPWSQSSKGLSGVN